MLGLATKKDLYRIEEALASASMNIAAIGGLLLRLTDAVVPPAVNVSKPKKLKKKA